MTAHAEAAPTHVNRAIRRTTFPTISHRIHCDDPLAWASRQRLGVVALVKHLEYARERHLYGSGTYPLPFVDRQEGDYGAHPADRHRLRHPAYDRPPQGLPGRAGLQRLHPLPSYLS